ncbi:MAG: glycosyltransferase [Candidatus Acidiferrales bacterium]
MRRKILHVVGGMDRGGVETWLMHVMRNIDRNRFETHFMVHSNAESAYDREITSLGGQIHHCANPRNPLRYAAEFERLVRQQGGFDIVHSHVYWFSGFVMRLAHRAGIPIRIAHSHTSAGAAAWNIPRQLYERLMRRWIRRYSTHRLGISNHAGKALFGSRGAEDFTLLYYGADFARFLDSLPSTDAKRRLGIDPDRKVIGHVGRFASVKNHAFIVEFFARLIGEGANTHLLLVGEGPLAPSIRANIGSRGLSDRCTLAGSQPDVVPYLSAMDVFVLPSRWEGLGLAAIESQAAGVPVIASTTVPDEIDVIPELIEHIPLSAGVDGWASAVRRKLNDPIRRRGDEVQLLQNSKFGLQKCLEALSGIYLDHKYYAAEANS